MAINAGEWQVQMDLPNQAVVQYKFFVDGQTYFPDPNNTNTVDDGFGAKNSVKDVSCGNVCSSGSGGAGGASADAYDWRSAILYFVFVDRFNNGDPSNDAPVAGIETKANYQGGDYQGVIQKLNDGYFTDLGVNALWITVPMDNPSVAGAGTDGHQYSGYHGYWPSNIQQVEEHFGTMKLLQELVASAHSKNIKVLFDYTMKHVHISSPTFTQHPDWFWPLQNNNTECICGGGCSWDGVQGQQCWFTDYLPAWNHQNPDARAASTENALWWIQQAGIDGFRLDAIKQIDPSWLSAMRTLVNTNVDQTKTHFYMVGETFDTSDRDFIKSFIDPTTLDGQFDFPLRGVVVDSILRRSGSLHDLDNFLATNDSFYSPGIMSTFLGNQDISRVIQTCLDSPWGAWDTGGTDNWDAPPTLPAERAPFERLGLGFAFLMTTQGIPLIYYGDEIGMPGATDPDNRRMMQFNGLSSDQQWLHDRVALLAKLRAAHPALWKGTRTTVSVTDDTYAYEMSSGADVLYVAINRSDLPHSVDGLPSKSKDLVTGSAEVGPSIDVPARSVMILQP